MPVDQWKKANDRAKYGPAYHWSTTDKPKKKRRRRRSKTKASSRPVDIGFPLKESQSTQNEVARRFAHQTMDYCSRRLKELGIKPQNVRAFWQFLAGECDTLTGDGPFYRSR